MDAQQGEHLLPQALVSRAMTSEIVVSFGRRQRKELVEHLVAIR
jgi:hypothetical protein